MEHMDSDTIKGKAKQGIGKAKEEWGDLTDDGRTEIGGREEQAAGKAQESWGRAKDTVRDMADDRAEEDDLRP